MSNAPTKIQNISLELLAMPSPYYGLLPPAQFAIVADGATGVQNVFGGIGNLLRIVELSPMPTASALSSHGAPLVPEVLASAAPTIGLVPNVSRFDVVAGGGNIAAVLPDGLYVGQRKRLYQISATGSAAVTVTPIHMAEGRTSVALKCLGAWADLDWTQPGWVVSAVGSPTAGAVAIT